LSDQNRNGTNNGNKYNKNNKKDNDKEEEDDRSVAEVLIDLINQNSNLFFKDQYETPFVRVLNGDHHEVIRIGTIGEWSSKMDANPPELTKALDSLKNELGYFVHLIEKDEIKESFILEYYRKQLNDIDATIADLSTYDRPKHKKYPSTEEIKQLIKKYDSLAAKKRKHKIGFRGRIEKIIALRDKVYPRSKSDV
jgi:hypothetical protein